MRPKIMAANWKMYKTAAEAADFVADFLPKLNNDDGQIIICPPATLLEQMAVALKNSSVKLGIQNIHWQAQGAYTGEISADMAKAAGAEYCLCGHSERRHIFGESSEMVARKAQAAYQVGLIPIICIGETLQERENGDTLTVLKEDLLASLSALDPNQKIIIAYEPVWAIGTGQVATADDAEQAASHIRAVLAEAWGHYAEQIAILYGGSVKSDNIDSLLACANIDGALVGGASLSAASFADLANTI